MSRSAHKRGYKELAEDDPSRVPSGDDVAAVASMSDQAVNLACITAWIVLSAAMVLFNKWLLTPYGFNFPIALTLWHMLLCSALAWALVRMRLVQAPDLTHEQYVHGVLPIACCFAGVLWAGNAAYAVSSVPFIQMVKASQPVFVYIFGCMLGTETYSALLLADITIIAGGVAVSAYGENDLYLLGLTFILIAIALEAVRLSLSQRLIQRSGVQLDPVTTLYHVAPPASLLLAVPFFVLEYRGVVEFLAQKPNVLPFLINGLNSFALNVAVYLLIGRTSALTLNVCGIIKDVAMFPLSMVMFASEVTHINMVGYGITLSGVLWYNVLRRRQAKGGAAAMASGAGEAAKWAPDVTDEEQGVHGVDVEIRMSPPHGSKYQCSSHHSSSRQSSCHELVLLDALQSTPERQPPLQQPLSQSPSSFVSLALGMGGLNRCGSDLMGSVEGKPFDNHRDGCGSGGPLVL